MTTDIERILPQVFRTPDVKTVRNGIAIEHALPELLNDAMRIVLFVSRSLDRDLCLSSALTNLLGGRLAATIIGSGETTTDQQVVTLAMQLSGIAADAVVTIGGGALIDTVKMVLLAHANGVETITDLQRLRMVHNLSGQPSPASSAYPALRQIAVPTTLTGAEFSDLAGSAPDMASSRRYYLGLGASAAHVIYDPWLLSRTPRAILLASGMRAVDHAIEGYCSIRPVAAVDAVCLEALRYLGRGLSCVAADGNDLHGLHACQTGAWLAATALGRVPFGASHGLSHLLIGATDVPHGVTSAVLLPAVLRYNKPANAERQHACAEALGIDDDLASAVSILANGLGLSTAWSSYGVCLADLDNIAESAKDHFIVQSNPRRIQSKGDVMEIFRACCEG